MTEKELQAFSKAELIYYIQQMGIYTLHSCPAPAQIILEKRIKDNFDKVDKLLEESHNENMKMSEFIFKNNGKITAGNLGEYNAISKELDRINKAIDKCWSENDKYEKILYGERNEDNE